MRFSSALLHYDIYKPMTEMSELILWPSVGYVGYQNNTVGSEGDPLSLVMTSLANSETLTEKLTFEQVKEPVLHNQTLEQKTLNVQDVLIENSSFAKPTVRRVCLRQYPFYRWW